MVGQSEYSAPPFLDEDNDEDALSLCDLALDDYQFSNLPPSSSSEFFEFFSGSSQLCPAEDVIFCGKLVPYQSPPPVVPDERQSALRKRSESLPELQSRRSGELDKHMMRNSRSLDYQKLHRSPEIEKKASPPVPARPRWYLLMFGMVKVPSEMELKDIKSRQFRRNPANSGAGKGTWGLLRALSCKDHTSVAVTTPFGRRAPET